MSTEILPLKGIRLKGNPISCVESEVSFREEAVEPRDMLSRVLSDHYRCPEDFVNFALTGKLSSNQGYFRFGPNALCYGRSCSGTLKPGVHGPLYDALTDVSIDNETLRLPFNPIEVIENLRLEHYAKRIGLGSRGHNILRKLYYVLRPLMNLQVRGQVQKFWSRNWEGMAFPQWPVDTTVETIRERLLLLSLGAKGVGRLPFVWFWPDGAHGCFTMTHDVEAEAGRNFCEDLMDVDDKFGIKASFNLVPEGSYEVSSQFLESIRARGFDVGVQDLNHDGRLFDSREDFLRRAEMINRYAAEYGARGFRAAVLYRNPEWYDALDFSFDMSIPNVAHLDPQRGGCCTVMPYFIGDVVELPVTTTQDYMLFYLLKRRSIALWKAQVELILKKNGMASFIVHPDYVLESDTRSVYEELLGYLRDLCLKENIWFALPAHIDEWWRARSRMRVEKAGNSWRIEGEGAERAVLAYAKNVDGNLVYEVASARGATCAADHDIAPLP